MWGHEANPVANKSEYIRDRGVCVEKIPQKTEVQETEKRKLNVLQIFEKESEGA